MSELKALWHYFREHRSAGIATIAGLMIGAALGVIAYYNSWLG